MDLGLVGEVGDGYYGLTTVSFPGVGGKGSELHMGIFDAV